MHEGYRFQKFDFRLELIHFASIYPSFLFGLETLYKDPVQFHDTSFELSLKMYLLKQKFASQHGQ